MGVKIKIYKDAFVIDAQGIPQLEELIGTKISMNFKSTFININIRDIKGVEMIELVDVRKPNRKIHFSAVAEVIDINGTSHTGEAINSNGKIFSLLEGMLN